MGNYETRVLAAVTAAMTAKDASQAGLAAATGIPRATLQRRLVNGDFTLTELDKIAGHLGVKVESLAAPRAPKARVA